jgi:hypothetical protein
VKYQRVGASLLRSTSDLEDLSDESATYGNAIAIIAVHAVIAYADALSVRFGGIKSGEGDHVRAVETLKETLGPRADAAELSRFKRVLSQKDEVAYQGSCYTVDDARRLADDARQFGHWADDLLTSKP